MKFQKKKNIGIFCRRKSKGSLLNSSSTVPILNIHVHVRTFLHVVVSSTSITNKDIYRNWCFFSRPDILHFLYDMKWKFYKEKYIASEILIVYFWYPPWCDGDLVIVIFLPKSADTTVFVMFNWLDKDFQLKWCVLKVYRYIISLHSLFRECEAIILATHRYSVSLHLFFVLVSWLSIHFWCFIRISFLY